MQEIEILLAFPGVIQNRGGNSRNIPHKECRRLHRDTEKVADCEFAHTRWMCKTEHFG